MSLSLTNLARQRVSLAAGCLAWLLLGFTFTTRANQGVPPLSSRQPAAVLPAGAVQQIALPPTDVPAELAADAAAGKLTPLRFAIAVPVDFTPANSGTWQQLTNGRLWRLRLISTNATDLNFGFTQFWLPAGASLYVMSEGETHFQGPYTEAENTLAGQLWTPPVPGASAIVELFVPEGTSEEPRLTLGQVSTGYRDLFHRGKDGNLPKAGSCEIDVVCPQATTWANEIRSVARIIIGGTALCSGTLIMDAAGDFRPFFLTANHCGITSANAATVVVNWNYQSPTCGSSGLGASAVNNQSGAAFCAAKADVDFCLIELNQAPPTNFHVYYAGWDRSGTAPGDGVGIHHPNGDGKCISFSTNPFTTIDSCISSGSSTHWQVLWQNPPQGVTEPGSSGSGIWDASTHLVVGTLSGGPSSCGATANNLWDCYGKFALAWASGTAATNRLRDWLDPQNTGLLSKAGTDPSGLAPVLIPAGTSLLAEGCLPTNGVVDPGEVVSVSFALQNTGTASTTNLVAVLLPTNGVINPSGSQNYGILAVSGKAVTRTFMFMANSNCGATILPTLQLQDGGKNFGTVSYNLRLGVATLSTIFSQNFDATPVPLLPSGWTTTGGTLWATTAAQSDTPPNSVFTSNSATTSDSLLVSSPILVDSVNAQLSFRHYYNTEPNYDGCVLEISVNGALFADIVSAGGSFVTNGYNAVLSTCCGNLLGGRPAWSGNSGGFLTTTVNLPPGAAGQNVRLRWWLGSDSSVGATGWYIDSISLSSPSYLCCSGAPAPTLTAIAYNANQQLQFSVGGATGYSYAVVGATNLLLPLSNWTSLTTNIAPFTFIDSNAASLPRRFYLAQHR